MATIGQQLNIRKKHLTEYEDESIVLKKIIIHENLSKYTKPTK
jgi:hypothetical protein